MASTTSVKGSNPLCIKGMTERNTIGKGRFLSVDLMAAIKISGITKNAYGTPLGSCVVKLYRTNDDVEVQSQISDPSTGAYAFYMAGGGTYYVVAYLAGSPDVAGTTVNTLVGG